MLTVGLLMTYVMMRAPPVDAGTAQVSVVDDSWYCTPDSAVG